MSYAETFNAEICSIETRFKGGLSNTSTKKFDELVKIVSEISGVEEDKIYITAATSRASNLWNRLAQGKPLTQHFSMALGIIDASDLQGGLSPASKFIGAGVGHYDAIALAVKRNNVWTIGAVLDTEVLPIYDKFVEAFPGSTISHDQVSLSDYDGASIDFAWYVGATGNDKDGNWHDFSEEFVEQGVWVNGWDDKFTETVKQIQVGDRIVIKSVFNQKNNLPFDNQERTVGAMRLKAIGVVTENLGDGKNLRVEWTALEPIKTWYGPGTLRTTIHGISANDGEIKRQLLDFTFSDSEQDYSLCEEYYATENETQSQEDGAEIVTAEAPDSTAPSKVKTNCLSITCQPRSTSLLPLNFIIFGAPGTGKTYSTAEYALAIIEERAVDKGRKVIDERRAIMAKYNDYIRNGQVVFTTFHQSYGYEEFIQGLRPDTSAKQMAFKIVDGVFKRIADAALTDHQNNYVIIIDEINRANISKVFGELITLIEEDKRWGETNETCATLQSGDPFAVPNNLYIVGTMNSADKSISLIDAALRRRFAFFEQYPDETLVDDPTLRKVLKRLNELLADALESSDLLIGHSYFMGKTEDDLCAILNSNIIPLLYEYFYDKKKKVMTILADALKDLDIEIKDNKISRIYVEQKEDSQV